MIFGRVPTAEAAGATLAHTLRAGDRALKKGRILDTGDIAQLLAAGITDVIAARLEPGELDEDAAAAAVASALAGEHARAADSTTGRANVYADAAGLVAIDEAGGSTRSTRTATRSRARPSRRTHRFVAAT